MPVKVLESWGGSPGSPEPGGQRAGMPLSPVGGLGHRPAALVHPPSVVSDPAATRLISG